MRRDLVANVSHELRTPIGALQAVLENLVDGVEPADPETLAHDARPGRAARPAGRAAARPLAAGVRRGRRSSARRVRAAALLEQVAADWRQTRERRARRRLRVVVEPATLDLDADAERLHQVVANLVENAVRHSPGRRTVIVGRRRARTDGVPDRGGRRGPGHPARPRPSASSSASTAPTRRARAATAAPASASRSRAGSSSCTAGRSGPRREAPRLPDGRGAARSEGSRSPRRSWPRRSCRASGSASPSRSSPALMLLAAPRGRPRLAI